MGAGDLELLDVLITTGDDDEPRLKVGDQASGAGVGQDCAYLASDGFVSMPNGPDGSGACGQAVCWTPGNDRIVIACADGRFNAKAGTLAEGDRAIVSNCDAALKLTKAANKIALLATAQGLSVTVDATGQQVTASAGKATMYLTQTAGQLAWTDTGVVAQADVLPSGVVLSYLAGTSACSITLGPGGVVAIVAPGGVTVNGVPLVVP